MFLKILLMFFNSPEPESIFSSPDPIKINTGQHKKREKIVRGLLQYSTVQTVRDRNSRPCPRGPSCGSAPRSWRASAESQCGEGPTCTGGPASAHRTPGLQPESKFTKRKLSRAFFYRSRTLLIKTLYNPKSNF